jgi:phosphoenolpyruvate carboxykinase (GTP)
MYVVPYLTGPEDCSQTRLALQLTDSPSVALNLRATVRMGERALLARSQSFPFVRGIHSTGDGSRDRRFVVHLSESDEMWSLGTTFGEDALFARKPLALRLATVQAREEGWLAENMMLLTVTDPRGCQHHVALAVPQGCGTRGLAMMDPALPGWRVEARGQETCWLRPASDGLLWAVDPRAGVAPWVSRSRVGRERHSLDGMLRASVARDLPAPAPSDELRPGPGAGLGSHSVPLAAVVFVGRRRQLAPIVFEARSWRHGVYVGATMASEVAAPQAGRRAATYRDPMVMRRFCGYNLGDYLEHWLDIGRQLATPPKIFRMNLFAETPTGALMWPGGGENIRILKWIVERASGGGSGRRSPLGFLPRPDDLDLRGMALPEELALRLLSVDHRAWLQESARSIAFLGRFGRRLPRGILLEHRALVRRLTGSLH